MKNFLKIFVFLLCFSFFGCLGIIDESLISSVSFEITIPESIEKQSSSARTATTDNLKLRVDLETKDSEEVRTEEKNVSEGETVSISFEEIPVESEIRLVGKLFDSESNVLYSGESEWVVIQSGKNTVNLEMKKVITEDDTEGGDNTGEDDNTDDSEPDDKVEETPKDVIVDAAEPTEVMDLTPFVFVKGSDVTSTTLQCSGMSTDEGVITFQWEVKNANGEWKPLEARGNQQALNLFVSILDVFATDFEVNEVKDYRCIVTNTNDKVNGNKTASVTKYTTIAYVEGILSSMKAEYKNDCYEIFGTDFTYENINVTEEWISGENSFKFTIPASNTRYEVKQNSTTGESVIGDVPYTITYRGENANPEKPLSQELTIPVKYLLKTADLQLSSYFNDSYVSTSEDGKTLKVPQYGTVKYELTLPESVGGSLTIIKAEGEPESIKDLTISGDYYSTKIYKEGTLIENDASCEVAGVYKYKLAINSENEWFVCEENNTKEFDVEVCTWNMSVTGTTKNDSGEFVLNDTSTPQCSVSATNEAISNITVSFYDGDTELTGGTFVVYAQSTTQRKEIIAKVGTIEVGTVVVIIPGHEAGSISNPITSWGDLVTAMQNEGGDIYIKGSLTADSTLNIEKDRAIIADGAVTITRDQNFNGTLFNVNNNFVLKGENANSSITIDGNGVSAENTIISTNYNVSLEYVTMTNCNSTSDNGIIDVSNSEILSLKNCSFIENSINNTVYISGENIEATIENCSFSDSCVDLSIINANIVSINNSSFDQDNIKNLSITKCPTLELGENLKIPLIYYNNSDVTNSELDILCKDTYLSDENIPIYLRLAKYANDEASYDLDLFADDQIIPDSVFVIYNSNYVLNTSTGVVEPVSSGESGSESSNAVVDFTTLQTAINNANGTETNPFVINVAANESGIIDIKESITINSHIKLVPVESKNVTLSRNAELTDQNLFVVSANASLTIGDASSSASIIIDGNSITSTKSLINVASGGNLILNKNCVLQNNTCPDNYNSSNGSAVYSNGGTIEINGAKICNNKVLYKSKSGGGIYLENGSFYMNSGTFEGNSVSANGNKAYGGAIALYSCDLIQIKEGTFTNNNVSATDTECYGGAIFISNAPTGTTISNCIFNQNKAYQKGAAIYIGGTATGTVAISSCDFSGNSITNTTDGTVSDIFVGNSSCVVTVDNTTISEVWNQN